jgi:hypothetical protein
LQIFRINPQKKYRKKVVLGVGLEPVTPSTSVSHSPSLPSAIPYRARTGPEQGQNRARTGPEQGFPCVLILTGKNLFSLQGTPVLIAGNLY